MPPPAAPSPPPTAPRPVAWNELFDHRILSTDSAHPFFVTAQALAARATLVAEVGCGRGALVDATTPAAALQDLRGAGRCVVGIDIDPAGAANPVLDEFRLIGPDGRWPFADGSVDLAVSDFVLEHVTDPEPFVAELVRTLRPGGVFLARTVNRYSLLALAARLVPNRAHARALEVVQPGRWAEDVFPTRYFMNTRRALARLLDDEFDWAQASRPGLDRYLGPWPAAARVAVAVEARLPQSLQTALVLCARRKMAPL